MAGTCARLQGPRRVSWCQKASNLVPVPNLSTDSRLRHFRFCGLGVHIFGCMLWATASISFLNGLLCTDFRRHQHRRRRDARTPTDTPTQPMAPTDTSMPTPTCQLPRQHPHPQRPLPPTPTPTPTPRHAMQLPHANPTHQLTHQLTRQLACQLPRPHQLP